MGSVVAGILAVALTVIPADGGVLSAPQITINANLGDQYDPHVDQNLAAYSSYFDPVTQLPIEEIRYYDFATGIDRAIPTSLPDGGRGRDLLSDVDQGRIVFTRIFDAESRSGILLFDSATNTVTELAPAPNSQRLGVALGAQTAAFVDYGLSGDMTGELLLLSLSGGAATRITNDTVQDVNPAVAPDGNLVVWERCPVSQANCDVYAASRAGTIWTWRALSTSTLNEIAPDTNGTQVVFERELGTNDSTLVVVPVAGGAETIIELPGVEHNASIRGQLIAFEHREGIAPSDIWLYDLATNRAFRVTNTPTVNETLNDVTVLPGGEVRVVWQANDGSDGLSNIYGSTFVLPALPQDPPDAGSGGGTDGGVSCANRSATLEATRTYAPSRWIDGNATFSPALSFAIPAELPVVAGNSGNKWASLTIRTGASTVICHYRGGSSQAHPSTPAQLALASRYVFSTCEVVRSGGGCDDDDDGDDEDDDDDHGDDDHGHGGHGRHRHGPWGHRRYAAGDVITATGVTLHVQNGDSWRPMTKVRLTLSEVCSTSTSMHPLTAGAPEGAEAAAGCSSVGASLVPTAAFLVLASLLLRRRPASIRVVARRGRRTLPR